MNELVSQQHFDWFLSFLVGGASVYWIGIDSYRLRKWLRGDRQDLANRDRIVGSMLGILVGLVGVGGVFVHYLK